MKDKIKMVNWARETLFKHSLLVYHLCPQTGEKPFKFNLTHYHKIVNKDLTNFYGITCCRVKPLLLVLEGLEECLEGGLGQPIIFLDQGGECQPKSVIGRKPNEKIWKQCEE